MLSFGPPPDPGSGNAMFGMITQLADSQIDPQPVYLRSTGTSLQPPTIKTTGPTGCPEFPKVLDPLRELVISSTMENYPQEILQSLAIQAANIDTVETVDKPSSTPAVQNCINDMFLLGATVAAKNKFEEVRKKQFSTLDPSDSDGFGEAPLLGKISRQRRARSANARNSSAKSNTAKPVVETESTDSENDNVTVTYEPMPKEEDEVDFATERYQSIKESMLTDGQYLRPTNIDVALGIPINTFDTMTGYVAGAGSGIEVENGDITKTKDYHRKKRRPKTARTNK